MADQKISDFVELYAIDDDTYMTVVVEGTPNVNRKVQRQNTGLARSQDLADHEADTANPHATTYTQVGADPAGSAAAVQAALDSHTGDGTIHFTVASLGLGTAAFTDSTAYDSAGSAVSAVSGHESTYDHTLIATALQPGDAPTYSAGTSIEIDGADAINNPHATVGFVDRTSSTLAFDSGTRVFTLGDAGAGFRVWTDDAPLDFTADVTVEIPDVTGFYFISMDAAGALQAATGAWNIAGPSAPVATLYYNASAPTEYVLSDERHSYQRNPLEHRQQHQARGAYWITGLSGTFGDTNGSVSIAAGSYADEDVVHSFTGPSTQGRLVYRASGAWRVDAAASDIRKQAAGVLQYDNAGTLADAGINDYVNYWVYAVNTPTPELHVLVGQATHGGTADALAESPDGLTLPPWIQAEGRLLYRVTYQRTPGTPAGDIYQTPTDFRQVAISGGVTLSGSFLPTALPEAQVWVGNASGQAAAVTISGDATLASDGTLTLTAPGGGWDGDIADIDLDGGTDIGADLADADLILVDDGANGTNRKSALSRVWTWLQTKFGTGVATALGINVGTAGSVVVNGGALGTPSSGTLTNCSGLPASGVTGTALLASAIGTTVQAYDADLTTWAGITPGTGVGTALAVNAGSAGAVGRLIALGTASLGTSSISSGSSATVVTVSAPGVAATDVVDWGFNQSPLGVTGYNAASTSGCLVITAYPTANNVNFVVSNPTSGAITPGAMTLNWKVVR